MSGRPRSNKYLEENTAGKFLLQFPWRNNDGFNLREFARLHQPALYSYLGLGLHLTVSVSRLPRYLCLGLVIVFYFRPLRFDLVQFS